MDSGPDSATGSGGRVAAHVVHARDGCVQVGVAVDRASADDARPLPWSGRYPVSASGFRMMPSMVASITVSPSWFVHATLLVIS